jgi:hypothetical protein
MIRVHTMCKTKAKVYDEVLNRLSAEDEMRNVG